MQKRTGFSLFPSGKLTTKDICAIGMLLAITAVLSIFCTFRIGSTIKIPTKFISVFVSAVFYGPIIGGFVGAAGDILNVFLAPSGGWIPALTGIEFLCGVIYGVLFYGRAVNGSMYFVRVGICTVLMFITDMLLSSLALTQAGYFPNLTVAFGARIVAGVLKALIQAVVLGLGSKYLGIIKRSIK